MSEDQVISLGVDAMELALKVAAPLLLAGLVVGLVISVFQAVTQIQEMTLSFIPKLLVAGLVLMLAGPWMLDQVVSYAQDLYLSIPQLIGA